MSWAHDYWVDVAEREAEEAGLPQGLAVEALPPRQRDKCWNCSKVPEAGKRLCNHCRAMQSEAGKRRRKAKIAQEHDVRSVLIETADELEAT